MQQARRVCIKIPDEIFYIVAMQCDPYPNLLPEFSERMQHGEFGGLQNDELIVESRSHQLQDRGGGFKGFTHNLYVVFLDDGHLGVSNFFIRWCANTQRIHFTAYHLAQ